MGNHPTVSTRVFNLKKLEELLGQGIDPDAVDKDGKSFLRHACADGNLGIVRFLVARGADVNSRDIDGKTPLMAAAITGRVEIADLLMEYGADPLIETASGDSAIKIAQRWGYKTILERLLRVPDQDGLGASNTVTDKTMSADDDATRSKTLSESPQKPADEFEFPAKSDQPDSELRDLHDSNEIGKPTELTGSHQVVPSADNTNLWNEDTALSADNLCCANNPAVATQCSELCPQTSSDSSATLITKQIPSQEERTNQPRPGAVPDEHESDENLLFRQFQLPPAQKLDTAADRQAFSDNVLLTGFQISDQTESRSVMQEHLSGDSILFRQFDLPDQTGSGSATAAERQVSAREVCDAQQVVSSRADHGVWPGRCDPLSHGSPACMKTPFSFKCAICAKDHAANSLAGQYYCNDCFLRLYSSQDHAQEQGSSAQRYLARDIDVPKAEPQRKETIKAITQNFWPEEVTNPSSPMVSLTVPDIPLPVTEIKTDLVDAYDTLLQGLKSFLDSLSPHEVKLIQPLKGVIQQLSDATVTVTFCGHFSSGKSTLLNSLIRRDLLPVKDLPETGTPCVLKRGMLDRAEVITTNGPILVHCTEKAISEYVSLRCHEGQHNDKVNGVRKVEIRLTDFPGPQQAVWVDSPGLNESSQMEERAREVIGQSDILIWILNSKQFLSIAEQRIIEDHVMEGGPWGVVFVLNAFLSEDTDRTMANFRKEILPVLRIKLCEHFPSMGFPDELTPNMLVVSARAMRRNGSSWCGGSALRDLLLGLDSCQRSGVLLSRVYRVACSLSYLAGTLKSELGSLREQNQAWISDRDARISSAEKCRAAFQRGVEESLQIFFGNWTRKVRERAELIANSISSESFARDGTYGSKLSEALQTEASSCLGQLIMVVNDEAVRLGQRALSSASNLKSILMPQDITVEVALNKIGGGGAAAGAATGAAAGSFLPGIGTLIGAAIGAAIGGLRSLDKAVEKDIEDTKANVKKAANEAIARLKGKEYEAREAILQSCLFPLESRTSVPPGRSRELELEGQVSVLVALADEANSLIQRGSL